VPAGIEIEFSEEFGSRISCIRGSKKFTTHASSFGSG
jgi:hypothetical protein